MAEAVGLLLLAEVAGRPIVAEDSVPREEEVLVVRGNVDWGVAYLLLSFVLQIIIV